MKEKKHADAHPVETERLLLRPFRAGDVESAHRLWLSRSEVQREYGEPVYGTLDEARALIEGWLARCADPDFYRFAIIEKSTGECVGQIAFCRQHEAERAAEIEYCVASEKRGRGYAPEALDAFIAYVFEETGYERLEAFHRAENVASGRVLAKSRLKPCDGVLRFAGEARMPEGLIFYALHREEYERARETKEKRENSMELTTKISHGRTDFTDAMTLRALVFIEEQGFRDEFDDTDAVAWHAVLYDGGLPVATGRLFSEGEGSSYHIGRVAVRREYRGKDLGRLVMKALEEKAAALGGKAVVLSAQCRAQGFYEKLGYTAFGEEYPDEGCPHIDMKKSL